MAATKTQTEHDVAKASSARAQAKIIREYLEAIER